MATIDWPVNQALATVLMQNASCFFEHISLAKVLEVPIIGLKSPNNNRAVTAVAKFWLKPNSKLQDAAAIVQTQMTGFLPQVSETFPHKQLVKVRPSL